MKLSNKQAQMLVQVLCDSLSIQNHFGYSQSTREALYKQIIDQQDNELKDLDKPSYAEMQATGAQPHPLGLLGSLGMAHYGAGLAQANCLQCGKAHAGYTCEEAQ